MFSTDEDVVQRKPSLSTDYFHEEMENHERNRRASAFRRKKVCRRRNMTAILKEYSAFKGILLPPGPVNLYRCGGTCIMPMRSKRIHTYHAKLQIMIAMATAANNKGRRPKFPCCSPKSYTSLNIMRVNETGSVKNAQT